MTGARFSPDGSSVLTIARRARLFDASTGAPIRTFDDPVDIRGADLSPDGATVVQPAETELRGCGRPARARPGVWRERTPRLLRGHTKAIVDARFSGSGDFVVTASNDRTARVLERPVGSGARCLPAPTARATERRLQPGRDKGGHGQRQPDHGAARGSAVRSHDWCECDVRDQGASDRAALSRRLVGRDDEQRRLDAYRSLESESRRHRLDQDEDVISAAFSPDGTRLVTASEGATAYVWQLVDGDWSQSPQ